MGLEFEVDYSKVPVPRMADAVRRYVEKGIQPGHFLMALLSNDLMDTIGRADDENAAAIKRWAIFVRCELPVGCHGSRSKMTDWMRFRQAVSEAKRPAVME